MAESENQIINIETLQDAKNLVAEPGLLLLGFKAAWCPQCTPQHGIVERVCSQLKQHMRFAYIDLSKNNKAAEAFSVTALPTLAIFRDGVEISRFTSFTAAPKLKTTLNEYLNVN